MALAARAAGAGRGRSCRRAPTKPSGWRRRLAAMGAEAVPEHRIMAHYDLAKFWSGQNEHATRLPSLAGRPCAAAPVPAVLARGASRPSSTPISRCFDRARFDGRPARPQRRPGAGVHRRHAALGHHAVRADPRRPSRGPWRRRAGRARRGRSRRSAAARRPPRVAAHRRDWTPDAGRGGDALPRGTARACAGQDAHRRQDAGQLSVSRPRRPDAARRTHHPLRARPARHRPVDLHLPVPRPSRLCARSRRSRLDDRSARSADGALARRAAEPDPDRQAGRLGRGFQRHAGARAGPSRSAARSRTAHAFTKPTAACAR